MHKTNIHINEVKIITDQNYGHLTNDSDGLMKVTRHQK